MKYIPIILLLFSCAKEKIIPSQPIKLVDSLYTARIAGLTCDTSIVTINSKPYRGEWYHIGLNKGDTLEFYFSGFKPLNANFAIWKDNNAPINVKYYYPESRVIQTITGFIQDPDSLSHNQSGRGSPVTIYKYKYFIRGSFIAY